MLRALKRILKGREAGFTLIELMIVILVILILAAILVPQFGLSRERARKAKCVSNQRNIETAVAMWVTDNISTNYSGGTMATVSNPNIGTLAPTSGMQYTTPGAFYEPDDTTVTSGIDYYLSNGSTSGAATSANAAAPSYGHVACAYDGQKDPWVASYDVVGGGTSLNHTRGASASP